LATEPNEKEKSMKIAITCNSDSLDAPVDPRFGRAASFLIFDTETEQTRLVPNEQNRQATQGAGIQAGQTVVDAGVSALITGNVGPKAFRVLEAGGVKVYLADQVTCREAIAALQAGRLESTSAANRPGHWS